jgi:hypothetical protein
MRPGILTVITASALALRCLTAQGEADTLGVVRGIVRDTLGKPVRHAIVQLLTDSVAPATGSPGRFTHYRSTIRYDSTDDTGRFRLELLSPGRFVLEASAVWMEGTVDSLILHGNDTLTVQVRMKVRYHAETSSSVRAQRLARLAEAEVKWAARRPARYRLTARLECFCPSGIDEPTALEFRNDSLVGTVDRQGRFHTGPAPEWREFSVPALFRAAEAAIRDLETRVTRIEYDPTYGFPTRIETDTVYGYTDSWGRTVVTAFRPIP